jgi:hypothetical protein
VQGQKLSLGKIFSMEELADNDRSNFKKAKVVTRVDCLKKKSLKLTHKMRITLVTRKQI